MPFESSLQEASRNFNDLSRNPYPGRGIVVGLDDTGDYMIQVYWIMGRKARNRNRVFLQEEDVGRLYTEPVDPSLVEDPSLIIYNAMRERPPHYIVSNGDQTDTVFDRLGRPPYLEQALEDRMYENDKPDFTQRITAVSSLSKGGPYAQMSILRRSRSGRCDTATYCLGLEAGFGFCITTYSGDGNPLPPFRGEPLLMPLMGSREEIAQSYWRVLNEENRISLAVKSIERGNGRSDIYIINRYQQVLVLT